MITNDMLIIMIYIYIGVFASLFMLIDSILMSTSILDNHWYNKHHIIVSILLDIAILSLVHYVIFYT